MKDLLLCSALIATPLMAAPHYPVDLPEQPLADALRSVGVATGTTIAFSPDTVTNHRAAALNGSYGAEEALRLLLRGSGLEAQHQSRSSYIVRPAGNALPQGGVAKRIPASYQTYKEGSLPEVPKSVAASGNDSATMEGIEEIVVTARRTSESLQDVPVSVTALSGDFLNRQGMDDISQITKAVPNLSLLQQSTFLTAASVTIRGVGNSKPTSEIDQAVGIYLNGVYIARAAGALFDFMDLERVEVLRGPQGTLFGRNTIGGAIQLITKRPTDNMQASAKAGYGRYNDWYTRGRLDTGYIGNSNIKLFLSGMYRSRDGYITNELAPSASKNPGALRSTSFAGGLQGDFGNFVVNYDFDFNYRVGVAPYFQTVAAREDVREYFGQSPAFGGTGFLISESRINPGRQGGYLGADGRTRSDAKARVWGNSLTLAYAPFPEIELKSITAYRHFWEDAIITLSGNGGLRGPVLDFNAPTMVSVQPITLYNGNKAPQKQWQFSQELQALGTSGDFSYVAGAYYFYEKSHEITLQELTLPIAMGNLEKFGFGSALANEIRSRNPGIRYVGLQLSPNQNFTPTSQSIAVFGQASWKPSAMDGKLELTGGVRYTGDRKTLVKSDTTPVQHGNANYDNVSWLGSLSYKFAPDASLYARVSTGYRSGGMNSQDSSGVLTPYGPEKLTAYEAGLKSEFFERRVRFNLSAFQNEYKDMQISQFNAGSGGATSTVVNAGSARFRGFEAELTAVPVRGLTFNGSLGYTDPKFKTYMFRAADDRLVNVADQVRLSHAAKWNANAGVQYAHPTDIGTLSGRLDFAYRSRIYFHNLDILAPFNRMVSSPPDYNLRARISLSEVPVGSALLDVGIWGDNLANQKNIDFGIDFGGLGFAGASYKKPRTFGGDISIKF